MELRLRKLTLAVAASLSAGMLAVPALAQQQQQQPQKAEKIEVTGTNIKRVDVETAAPITVITSEELKRSGATTLSEALRNLPVNATGGLNEAAGQNSFSGGASTISLRGLGSTATLVLLNGRRIAPYGLNDPNFGQASFVNIDSLPLDVVERVEILKDGASAIYGSEAIAGVVNIILRRDFKGALATGSFSQNKDSEYRTWRAGATLGIGDLGADRYNVFFNYEHADRELTTYRQVSSFLDQDKNLRGPFATGRPLFSSYSDQGNYYRAVFDDDLANAFYFRFVRPAGQCKPGLNGLDAGGVCRYDIWQNITVSPERKADSFYLRGTVDFTANLTAFGEFSYNKINTTYDSPPQIYGDVGSWFSATRNRLVSLPEVLPVGHPNNPFDEPIGFRHRFTEVGPSGNEVENKATRIVAGLKGTAGKWDWEAAYLFTENKTDVSTFNFINAAKLREGILNGTYNFLNPNAGAIKPSDIRANTFNTAKSSFSGVDAKASTELMQLASGPLGFAAGIEYRREERSATPDQRVVDGDIVGFGASTADGSRNVTSGYAELSIPITKTLESQLAVRTDRFSDYGRSTTPKIGLKWKALPSLIVRGTYAEGFRAPSLTENSKASVSAFTTVTDPKRCINGDEADCAINIAALLEANPAVRPEESKGFTGGIVWEPVKDASISIDYFSIKRNSEINLFSIDQILAQEDSPRFAGRVIRGTPLGDGLPGQLQAVRTFFDNLGETRVKGYDLDARYKFSLPQAGKLDIQAVATYYESFKIQDAPDVPLTEFIGYQRARVRGAFSVGWEYQDWTTTLTTRYTGKYRVSSEPREDFGGGPCRYPQSGAAVYRDVCFVPSWTTLDTSLVYRGVKDLELSLVIRNILNRRPPLDPQNRVYNPDYYNPFGQIYTLAATYKFK